MIQSKQETTIEEEITFKEYFNSLSDDDKADIRDAMQPIHMSYATFYRKVKDESFSPLEIKFLEELTSKKFKK